MRFEWNQRACLATVQAGCRLSVLEEALGKRNLRLGHIPFSLGQGVTAAGAAATYGIGAECSGFDTLADCVVGMKVVLPSGEMLHLKPSLKSSMGHRNLAWLFLGTEGAFGVITELTLRVRPFYPRNRAYVLIGVPSFPAAVRASYKRPETLATEAAINPCTLHLRTLQPRCQPRDDVCDEPGESALGPAPDRSHQLRGNARLGL